jgi:hypothetical protein
MNSNDIAACKQHLQDALNILEREADEQLEVHILLCLREVMEDLECLELQAQMSGPVVRLADIRELRMKARAAGGE